MTKLSDIILNQGSHGRPCVISFVMHVNHIPPYCYHVDIIKASIHYKSSGTCFWNSNTKQLGDLFQKQKIKGSLWNLCAVYAGL